MYRRAETLADTVWQVVEEWPWLAKKTVGVQWIRATDSVGANMAEAGGRYHPGEVRQFLYYARGSLRESKYWLRRAGSRSLIANNLADELDEAIERLSAEINRSIRHQRARRVMEPEAGYDLGSTTPPPHNRTIA